MPEALQLLERPETRPMVMLAGWRQWADAGSVSSRLPEYLIEQSDARKIGTLDPDGFYLFQIPGTHDLVRPMVQFENGYPAKLETPRNEFYYTETNGRGVVIFVGDEPHFDVERYIGALLDAAQELGVERIVTFGGVYGELPYDKERTISAVYSLPDMQAELEDLALTFSDYGGGAAIGSVMCKRASERDAAHVGLYAFVPTYNFSNLSQIGNTIQIENDFSAWLGIMRRVNYMLKTQFDLSDLEEKSQELREAMDAKVEQLESVAPQLEIREYLDELSKEFTEVIFDPLDDVWQDEIRRIFDEPDASEGGESDESES